MSEPAAANTIPIATSMTSVDVQKLLYLGMTFAVEEALARGAHPAIIEDAKRRVGIELHDHYQKIVDDYLSKMASPKLRVVDTPETQGQLFPEESDYL